jgi:hypothetical protein
VDQNPAGVGDGRHQGALAIAGSIRKRFKMKGKLMSITLPTMTINTIEAAATAAIAAPAHQADEGDGERHGTAEQHRDEELSSEH